MSHSSTSCFLFYINCGKIKCWLQKALPQAYQGNKEHGYLKGAARVRKNWRERWIKLYRGKCRICTGKLRFPPLSPELIKPSDRYDLHEIKAARSTDAFLPRMKESVRGREREREREWDEVKRTRERGLKMDRARRESRGMRAVIFLAEETYCRGSLRHSSGTRELQGERRECKHRCRCSRTLLK
jgi:hypothetical protein